MLILLLSVLSLLGPDTSRVTLPDTAGSIPPRITVQTRFRFFPTSVYTTSQGIGVGVGMDFRHIGRPGTLLQLSARPAQYRGIYAASFFTADPYRAPRYGLITGQYTTTSRQRYYGVGPDSKKESKIAITKEAFEAEGRMGFYTRDRRWLIQPNLRLMHHYSYGFKEVQETATESMTERSQQNLAYSLSDYADLVTGITLGIETEYDRLDDRENPSRGFSFIAGTRRFFSVTDVPITFDTYTTSAYGFIPIAGKNSVLSLRSLLVLTRNRSDETIPFYLLPTLDRELMPGYSRNRFFGNDVFLLSAEFRQELFTLPIAGRVQGTVALNAGSVYNDIFDEFHPSVSFSKDLGERDRYPLRPALGLGVRLLSPRTGNLRLHGMLGLSPEGISVVTFKFVQDIRKARGVVR